MADSKNDYAEARALAEGSLRNITGFVPWGAFLNLARCYLEREAMLTEAINALKTYQLLTDGGPFDLTDSPLSLVSALRRCNEALGVLLARLSERKA